MSSFTIGKKLFVGVGVLVAFVFALGISALISIMNLGGQLHTITGPILTKQVLAHEMKLNAANLASLARGIEVRGYSKEPAAIEKYHVAFLEDVDHLQLQMDTMMPMLVLPDSRQTLEASREQLGPIKAQEMKLYKAAMAGDMEAALLDFKELLPLDEQLSESMAKILKGLDSLTAVAVGDAAGTVESSSWTAGSMLTLAALVGIVMIFVVRQINSVLRKSVSELAESSVQIAAAANQVAASSQSMAQGASEQAATIEETSSASAEINSMARRTTENSTATAEMVTRSQQGFEKTDRSLNEMVDAMDGINASSQKISKIIKVIDEIAFQTNILALNAAVEAARAGEAGMGFAVVADEVRNLAQRCAQAAKDTADLIEDSIRKSNDGRVKVDQVAVAIRAITAESAQIKVLVDEINVGSLEQSRGIDQISRAITQMEQVTQSSAANAEQGAAAAEELSAQAQTMTDVVDGLKAMVDGQQAARMPPSSASMDRGLAFSSR